MPGPKGYYGNTEDDWLKRQIQELEFALYQNVGSYSSTEVAMMEAELARYKSMQGSY